VPLRRILHGVGSHADATCVNRLERSEAEFRNKSITRLNNAMASLAEEHLKTDRPSGNWVRKLTAIWSPPPGGLTRHQRNGKLIPRAHPNR
jgi:hypothetical protein